MMVTCVFIWAPGRAATGSASLRFFAPTKAGAKEPSPPHPWRTRSERHLSAPLLAFVKTAIQYNKSN
jgi:hypothetical protein